MKEISEALWKQREIFKDWPTSWSFADHLFFAWDIFLNLFSHAPLRCFTENEAVQVCVSAPAHLQSPHALIPPLQCGWTAFGWQDSCVPSETYASSTKIISTRHPFLVCFSQFFWHRCHQWCWLIADLQGEKHNPGKSSESRTPAWSRFLHEELILPLAGLPLASCVECYLAAFCFCMASNNHVCVFSHKCWCACLHYHMSERNDRREENRSKHIYAYNFQSLPNREQGLLISFSASLEEELLVWQEQEVQPQPSRCCMEFHLSFLAWQDVFCSDRTKLFCCLPGRFLLLADPQPRPGPAWQ